MIDWVIERTKRVQRIDEIVIATTKKNRDDILQQRSRDLDVGCFRGSEEDVLSRYYHASLKNESETIVRITADCPLIDPSLLNRIIETFQEGDYDYVSNVLERTYPDGLDCEVFTAELLKEMYNKTKEDVKREHVTRYLVENQKNYRTKNVSQREDLSDWRWTVDYPEDLEFVRSIYQRLDDPFSGYERIKSILKEEPELKEINHHLR